MTIVCFFVSSRGHKTDSVFLKSKLLGSSRPPTLFVQCVDTMVDIRIAESAQQIIDMFLLLMLVLVAYASLVVIRSIFFAGGSSLLLRRYVSDLCSDVSSLS